MKQKVTCIDSLKGIAILGVIYNHCGGALCPSFLGDIGRIGANGVQLFFVISAMLAYSSLDFYFDNHRKKITIKLIMGWWKKKFLRLIPLYYLSLVISALMGGNAYWLGCEEKVTIYNFITHVLFLHGFVPHYIDSIIGVEWYLGNLAIFYVIIPFIYKYVNSLEKAFILFVTSVFGCAAIMSWTYSWFPMTEDSYIYQSYKGNFWIFSQLPVLLFGIVVYFIMKSDFKERCVYKKWSSYIILMLSVFMVIGQMYKQNYLFKVSETVLFGIWFGGIIISQFLHKCILIDNRVFQKLGEYSYPLYLFHFIILSVYMQYMPLVTGINVLDISLRFVGVLIITFIVSVILTKYFDEPILSFICKK